jgi:DNA polymerase III sliding clamp (beta) subunit (PCNA family)
MVKVNVEKLKNALIQSLPSQNNLVLLKMSEPEGKLKVNSTDGDSFLSFSIDATVEGIDELEVLVNRKSLLSILKVIKSEYVFLSMIGGFKDYLIVENDEITYKLLSQNPALFEALFKVNDLNKDINNGILLNSKDIVDAINKVIHAVDNDRRSSDVFRSVGFIFQDNTLFIAGTDRSRLAICNLNISNNLNLNERIGIPKSAALHFRNIFKKDVLFNIVGSYAIVAVFKSDDFIFTTTVADDYPDVVRVINEWRENLVIDLKLSKEFMINILQSFVTERRDNYPIKLTLKDNLLNIFSFFNNNEINITIDYKGDRYEYVIGFDALYLLEAFKNVCGDNVILKLPESKNQAAYIESTDDCNCQIMVMPIRIP